MALIERTEVVLLDWVPVNSWLCAVSVRDSCKVSSSRSDRCNLFVILAYTPTDCSPDVIKGIFLQRLHDLLGTATRSNFMVLAGGTNAKVGRLPSNEAHLGVPSGLVSCRSEDGERLLAGCLKHRLFLTSTGFRRSIRRCATWCRPINVGPRSTI